MRTIPGCLEPRSEPVDPKNLQVESVRFHPLARRSLLVAPPLSCRLPCRTGCPPRRRMVPAPMRGDLMTIDALRHRRNRSAIYRVGPDTGRRKLPEGRSGLACGAIQPTREGGRVALGIPAHPPLDRRDSSREAIIQANALAGSLGFFSAQPLHLQAFQAMAGKF